MTTNPDPARIEALFHEALERSEPEERQTFLAAACEGDTHLLGAVLELLQAHNAAEGFLDGATFKTGRLGSVAGPQGESSGDVIGRYKLLQIIGQGGFGVVWMAEQGDMGKRRVALKIVKPGMDSREVVARFEQERHALAMMDHPNIARVFDGGVTPAGRPFFVMELVRGIPITNFCDEEKLPMAQRLALFVQVCHAIQHAHQKGIIHRDIKPSNILVTLGDDARPLPKVIDFGVAKAIAGALTDQTLFTQFEQMIGTPAYMSPEQAGAGPMDIDTRSDVYALGVLLYELLTGHPPFDPKALANAGFEEMRRVIREVEPPKPSTRVSTMQEAQRSSLALSRHTEGPKLLSSMKGELDWIVMKALEKNRTRRYDTANGLASDVERYLRNDPVLARPPSRAYLLKKLVRRHKTLFAAAGAVALVLIAGIAASTWQAVRATRAEGAAVAQRDRARLAEQAERDQRRLAETARGVAEHHLYAANMNLAQEAWRGNNISRLKAILEETRTYPKRGFEWYYWQRQVHLELRTLRGHGKRVFAVAFSPDGRSIVTGSEDQTAKVWDTKTGRELLTLKGHTTVVLSAAFSPDGRRIVTGSEDETSMVWDAETGRVLLTLKGHSGPGLPIKLFATESGRSDFTQHTGAVLSVAISSDGRRIVTGSWDRTAKVWDAETGREVLTLKGHTDLVWSAAFSSDCRRIITGSRDKTAKIWDAETGAELLTLHGHGGSVNSGVFSSDGSRIVTGSDDKTAKVWDAGDGRELLTLKGHEGWVYSAAFSPDGRRIATGSLDATARIWDAKTGRALLTLKGHADQIISVAFSPDGRRLVTGSDDHTAKIWDAERIREMLTLMGHKALVLSVAFSPDSRRIVTGSLDRTAKVWDAEKNRELMTLKGHGSMVMSVAFSPDGRRIVTGSEDKTAKVWDAETGRELHTLKGHSGIVNSVAFSPDGHRILTGGGDHTAKIWDTETGKESLTLKGHEDQVFSAVYSRDGRRIATGSDDHTAKIWDAETGREVLTLKGHGSWVSSVAFSRDGRQIVTGSGDKMAKVWDAETGRELLTLKGQGMEIMAVAFSPDSLRIVTGSRDNTAKVWDAENGRELLTLKSNADRAYAVYFALAFSPDGQKIVQGGEDKTAGVWMAASPEEVEAWRKEETK